MIGVQTEGSPLGGCSTTCRRARVISGIDPFIMLVLPKNFERKILVRDEVIDSMPRPAAGSDGFVDVEFFTVSRFLGNEALTNEYARRNLVPAGPYILTSLNFAEPNFCVANRNATIWWFGGKWYCLTFFRWGGANRLQICESNRKWRSSF